VADLATGSDTLASYRVMPVDISDPAQGTDNVTQQWVRVRDADDVATGTDQATAFTPPPNAGVPVYDGDVRVPPYADSVLVAHETPVRVVTSPHGDRVRTLAADDMPIHVVVRPSGDRVLVKVGTDG
jgi:hypothetical protein